MPFNSTLGYERSELSFYALVRASPTNSCLRTLAEPASKNEQTTRTRWTIWNSQWISKRRDNASIATCLDFRLHTMAMTDGKVSKEEKKQMDQAGFLNIVSISLGPGCLIHIMFFYSHLLYVRSPMSSDICLWLFVNIFIDSHWYWFVLIDLIKPLPSFRSLRHLSWDESEILPSWQAHGICTDQAYDGWHVRARRCREAQKVASSEATVEYTLWMLKQGPAREYSFKLLMSTGLIWGLPTNSTFDEQKHF